MPTDVTGACPYDQGPLLSKIKPYCDYFLAGEEHGEPTDDKPDGYHHWQFFFQLRKDQTWGWLHKRLPGIHLEPRRGTVEQCMEYCMKDGNFTQMGQVLDRPGQGRRTDIVLFVEDCKTQSDKDLWTHHPDCMARYTRVPQAVRNAFVEPRSWVTQLNWIFGEPGCGKTLYVQQKYPDLYSQDRSMWWDGYSGQETVLIDELNAPDFRFDTLLKIGNKGQYKVQVKGGYVEFVAKRLFIVSNIEPQQVYHKDWPVNAAALLRRTTFYRARKGAAHELLLQRVEYLHGNWAPVGDEVSRHVDYPDAIQIEQI